MDIHSGVAHVAMLNGWVAINNTTVTEIKIGSTALQERKWLYIMNASTVPIYIGSQTALGTAVTNVTVAKSGIKMAAGDAIWLPVSDAITVYGLSNAGAGIRLRVAELS